eukprot:tig00020563_g11373.t1
MEFKIVSTGLVMLAAAVFITIPYALPAWSVFQQRVQVNVAFYVGDPGAPPGSIACGDTYFGKACVNGTLEVLGTVAFEYAPRGFSALLRGDSTRLRTFDAAGAPRNETRAKVEISAGDWNYYSVCREYPAQHAPAGMRVELERLVCRAWFDVGLTVQLFLGVSLALLYNGAFVSLVVLRGKPWLRGATFGRTFYAGAAVVAWGLGLIACACWTWLHERAPVMPGRVVPDLPAVAAGDPALPLPLPCFRTLSGLAEDVKDRVKAAAAPLPVTFFGQHADFQRNKEGEPVDSFDYGYAFPIAWSAWGIMTLAAALAVIFALDEGPWMEEEDPREYESLVAGGARPPSRRMSAIGGTRRGRVGPL